jgi:DNA-binding response OmpR family regulator
VILLGGTTQVVPLFFENDALRDEQTRSFTTFESWYNKTKHPMRTILLVEDEFVVRNGLKNALEKRDYLVIDVSNGNEALAVLDTILPAVIITDILMPEKDGIELLFELIRRKSKVPIIAMSGGGRISPADHLENALKMGASAVLVKPFSLDELFAKIAELLSAS